MIVDVFAWGYEHDTYIRRIRDRWTGEALYELHDELVTAPVTTSQSKTSFMLIFADMTWLTDEILAELENPADRQAHVEYILDARDVGIQQIGLHVVCKANRHRYVAGGLLLFELARRIKDTSVSLTHMQASRAWLTQHLQGPMRPMHACHP